MSAYDGDSSYDASSRPTSRASSPLPDEPSTLLDTQLLIRYKAWMASNPGEVVTLDPTSSDLIYYILPSVNGKNKRAVEPRSLDTVFKTHGIALPHCFCLVKRNNDVVGTETEFVKRKNVFQFLCRRRTGGCGYSVSMDRFDLSRVHTEDAKTIASGGGQFSAGRAQFQRQLVVFYADSLKFSSSPGYSGFTKSAAEFRLTAPIDNSPATASRSSSKPSKATFFGPTRISHVDKRTVRFEPYSIKQVPLPRGPPEPPSPPRGVIERRRTPYGSAALTPFPSSSTAPLPPPPSPSFKSEPLPDLIMNSSITLATEGMTRDAFDELFVVCSQCRRLVFLETGTSHHIPMCRGP